MANSAKTGRSATGLPFRIEDVLSKQQMATVNSVARDLARTTNAQNLGRGVGSNTAQNLAMSNLLEQAGVPMGILNVPVLGSALALPGKVAPSEDAIRGLLAEAMLNPKLAATLMQRAEDAGKSAASRTGQALSYSSRPVLQGLLFVAGLALLAVATGLYIGARLGPGPRDGLMTGIHNRWGWKLWIVRTGIEVTVLTVGWLLGGQVGIGTLAFALLVGPMVGVTLPLLAVPLPRAVQAQPAPLPESAPEAAGEVTA